jgi:hypothetical protein
MSNQLFSSNKLNAQGVERSQKIREAFTRLYDELQLLCPVSRELSLVSTKLEEAGFFAQKAMSKSLENREEG